MGVGLIYHTPLHCSLDGIELIQYVRGLGMEYCFRLAPGIFSFNDTFAVIKP